ncbi:MAG: hypothetical protein DWQ37_04060 [Planctomycetota bacterium]|nr:MAG: hypothetical protein DWQ37_04060 [Planctomycetota bacterium]
MRLLYVFRRLLILYCLLVVVEVCSGQTQFGGNTPTKRPPKDNRKIRTDSGERVIRLPSRRVHRPPTSSGKYLGKVQIPKSPPAGVTHGEPPRPHNYADPFFAPRSRPRPNVGQRPQRYIVQPQRSRPAQPARSVRPAPVVRSNEPAAPPPPEVPTAVRRNAPPPADFNAKLRTAAGEHEDAFGSDPGFSDESMTNEEILDLFQGPDETEEQSDSEPDEVATPTPPKEKKSPFDDDDTPPPSYTPDPSPSTSNGGGTSATKSAKPTKPKKTTPAKQPGGTKKPKGKAQPPQTGTAQSPQGKPLGKINMEALGGPSGAGTPNPGAVSKWPNKYSSNPAGGTRTNSPEKRWPKKYAGPRLTNDRGRSRPTQRQVTEKYLTRPTAPAQPALPGPRADPVVDGNLVPPEVHDLIDEQRGQGHPKYDPTYEGPRPESKDAIDELVEIAREIKEMEDDQKLEESFKKLFGSRAVKYLNRANQTAKVIEALESEDIALNSENDVAREMLKAAEQDRHRVLRSIQSSDRALERQGDPEAMGRELQQADLNVAEAKQYAVEVEIRDAIHSLDKVAVLSAQREYNREPGAGPAEDVAGSQQRVESIRKHVEALRKLKDKHDAAKAEVTRLQRALQPTEN